jgi:hypothetical protein
MSDKALKACADYARLSVEIKRLTKSLGDSLSACPGVNGHLQFPSIGFSQEEVDRYNADETHLKRAYASDTDEDGTSWLSHSEKMEVLSACPHCMAAHEAIQARKAARKSLGAVKRAISLIGRAENRRTTQ